MTELNLYVVRYLDTNFEWDFEVVLAKSCYEAEEKAKQSVYFDNGFDSDEVDPDILESFEAYEYKTLGDGKDVYKITLTKHEVGLNS